MSDDDAQLEQLSRELLAVQGQMTRLREVEADLIGRVREAVTGQVGTISANGRPVFEVSYSKRFSADRAAEVLASNPDLLRAISIVPDPTPVVSSSLAKRVLSGALYEMCQKESDVPSIKVVA